MSKRKLVGICGPKGSGKSSISAVLCGKYDFTRRRFGGPLKEMLKVGFGLTDDHVDGHLKEVPTDLLCGQTPRHAMKTIGTEWGRRMIHNDIWLQAWRNSIPEPKPGRWNYLVVDDVRFPNEVEMLKRDFDATIIRVERPGYDYDPSHESEAHSELEYDYRIINDGDMEILSKRTVDVVREAFPELKV